MGLLCFGFFWRGRGQLPFADEKTGVYDARPLLGRRPFAPLSAPSFFMLAHVEHGTVVWNGDVDIAPDHLYDNCR